MFFSKSSMGALFRSLTLAFLVSTSISSAWCRDASGGPPVPALIPGAAIVAGNFKSPSSAGYEISQFEIPSGRTRVLCAGCGPASKLRVGRDGYIYLSSAYGGPSCALDDVMWRLDPDSGLVTPLPRGFFPRDMGRGSFAFTERNIIYGIAGDVCDPSLTPARRPPTPWVFRQSVPDGAPIPISTLTDPAQGYVPSMIFSNYGLSVERDGKLILATSDELIRIDPSTGLRELLYGPLATGGGIWGPVEIEPAGTFIYFAFSDLYRASPIPPSPYSVEPVSPRWVARVPLSDNPDLALDAHGRALVLGARNEASEAVVYRLNPVDGSFAVVLRIPTLQYDPYNRIAIVPPRPFDDCNPNSPSVQLCNTNLTLGAQPIVTNAVDFSLSGWFSIAKGSDGLNLLEEAVTLQIGDFSVTLPEGSLKQNQNGEYVFDGKVAYVARNADVESVPMQVRIIQVGGLQYNFTIVGTTKLEKPSGETTVNLVVGNDRGSTNLVAQIANLQVK